MLGFSRSLFQEPLIYGTRSKLLAREREESREHIAPGADVFICLIQMRRPLLRYGLRIPRALSFSRLFFILRRERRDIASVYLLYAIYV